MATPHGSPGCLLLAAIMACGLALSAPAQAATQVSCGQAIASDTKVGNDLANCPGNGLEVTANDVLLDLNGHTLDGTGSGAGVLLASGVDRVIVKNGRLQQFDDGVSTGGGDANRLLGLTLRDNQSEGIDASSETHLLVRNSRALDNGANGFFLSGSDAVIQGNTAEDNGDDGFTTSLDDSLFDGNQSIGSASSGFEVDGEGSLLRHNVAKRNDREGISLRAADNVLLDAQADDNGRNDRRSGIEVSASGNQVVDSTATGNPQHGILVSSGATGTLLKDNVGSQNDIDGIRVEESDTSLRQNKANDNGDDGIHASPGVTDLGGNRASGNDDEQCRNVSCD